MIRGRTSLIKEDDILGLNCVAHSEEIKGGRAHYALVSRKRIAMSKFWPATHLNQQNDWTGWRGCSFFLLLFNLSLYFSGCKWWLKTFKRISLNSDAPIPSQNVQDGENEKKFSRTDHCWLQHSYWWYNPWWTGSSNWRVLTPAWPATLFFTDVRNGNFLRQTSFLDLE